MLIYAGTSETTKARKTANMAILVRLLKCHPQVLPESTEETLTQGRFEGARLHDAGEAYKLVK